MDIHSLSLLCIHISRLVWCKGYGEQEENVRFVAVAQLGCVANQLVVVDCTNFNAWPGLHALFELCCVRFQRIGIFQALFWVP